MFICKVVWPSVSFVVLRFLALLQARSVVEFLRHFSRILHQMSVRPGTTGQVHNMLGHKIALLDLCRISSD